MSDNYPNQSKRRDDIAYPLICAEVRVSMLLLLAAEFLNRQTNAWFIAAFGRKNAIFMRRRRFEDTATDRPTTDENGDRG